jgi:hypothetical protein
MNLTLQKISIKFLLAFALFVGLFFCVDAVSAQQCCLVKEGTPGSLVTTGCKLKTGDECAEKDCLEGSYGGFIGCRKERIEEDIFCQSDIACLSLLSETSACGELSETACESSSVCFWRSNLGGCYSVYDDKICSVLSQVDCTASEACVFNTTSNTCDTKRGAFVESMYGGLGTGKILTRCAIRGDCTEINDILEVFINIGREIFKYIGAIAFVFFIYGGVTMILSFGSAEKFAKGRKVLVASVIGLIIAFSSYLIINFILDALGVTGYYRVLK